MIPSGSPPLVAMDAVSRRFGDTLALDCVSLRVGAGEVVALLGENGAGKTTLMRVLLGLVRPDSGAIRIDGRSESRMTARGSRRAGIAMVHQHFTLAPGLTVAENLALERGGRGLLWFDRKGVSRRARETAAELGFRVDPGARVGELSIGDRQRVEILKALQGASAALRVLVLDEPTAALAPGESDELLRLVRRLCSRGLGVAFISHKLREVLRVADRIVVLRSGRVVAERANPWRADREDAGLAGEAAASELAAELAGLMVGEGGGKPAAKAVAGLEEHGPGAAPVRDGGSERPIRAAAAPRLEARDVHVARRRGGEPSVAGASLAVAEGEVVAVAGVAGNGQSELCAALAGELPMTRGELRIDGGKVAGWNPRRAIEAGVAHVPADRQGVGLVMGLAIEDNVALRHRGRPELGSRLGLRPGAVRKLAAAAIAEFSVRPADPTADVAALSGGNQQRLLLARELLFRPRVVIAENPTAGLDLGATAFVHGRLLRAAADGAAVLVFTSDLDEALAIGGRLLVMAGGRLHESPSRDRRAIGLLMAGGGSPAAAARGAGPGAAGGGAG